MIKVEITSLGHESTVKDYKLNKKLDDFGVIMSVDSNAKFEGAASRELLELTVRGFTDEPATFNIHCGDELMTYDGFINHNEGKYNLKHCYAEKPLRFKTVYDCIKDLSINIFDYTPSEISTIQGDLQRDLYGAEQRLFLGDESQPYTLDQLLSILGGIPDRTSSGWVIEHISVTAVPVQETYFPPSPTEYPYNIYVGHDCQLTVTYVRSFSNTQISADWIELSPGAWYLNPNNFAEYQWNTPNFNSYAIYGEFGLATFYVQSSWTAGRYQIYKDINISNTYSLNEILEDIFLCSGKTLVSNFFGINPDGSEPNNSAYDYATNFLEGIRIVQSFDIIRENAIQDSFGRSGIIEAKKLIIDLNRFFGLNLIYDQINDVIRYEHYSYFNEKGLDLTNGSINYEVSPDMEVNKDIVNKETFTMGAETPTDGFYQSIIDYRNYQLNSEINDVQVKVENLLTDIFGTLNNEKYNADQYKKLFFLLATDGTAVIGLNNALKMRTVIQNLHDKNRPLPVGSLDGIVTEFTGFSKGLTTEIKFFKSIKAFNKLNPNNVIKTPNGIFVIDEINFEKETLTLKVRI